MYLNWRVFLLFLQVFCQDNIWLFCFDNCHQSITNIDWKFLFCFKFFLLNELFIYEINEKFESQVWNNPVILTEYLIFSRDVLFDFKGKHYNFRSLWKYKNYWFNRIFSCKKTFLPVNPVVSIAQLENFL